MYVNKKLYAEGGFIGPYGTVMKLTSAFPNDKVLTVDFDLSGGLIGDATYLYTPGTGGGSSATYVLGANANAVRLPQTTAATSTTTGALRVAGGVGIGGNLHVGGTITGGSVSYGTTTSGTFTVTNTTGQTLVVDSTEASTTPTTGAARIKGGLGIEGNLNVGGTITGGSVTYGTTSSGTFDVTNGSGTTFTVDSTTDATSPTTGAGVVTGGLGVGKNVYAGGNVRIGETSVNGQRDVTVKNTNAGSSALAAVILETDVSTAQIFVNGSNRTAGNGANSLTISNTAGDVFLQGSSTDGIRISSTENIMEQNTRITTTTPSTSTTTGALQVAGGVGIGGNLNVGGTISGNTISSTATTASTSNSTGSVTLAGGIGISNTTDATSATNGGSLTTAGGVAIAKKLIVGETITSTGDYVFAGNCAIRTDSVDGADNRRLVLTAGGADVGANRGAKIMMHGNEHPSVPGRLSLVATTTGDLDFWTSNLQRRGFISSSGVWNILTPTATTSSSTGAMVFTGGIGISNTTDATSATNGGTLTTEGGAAIGKKLFVGTDASITGNLAVTGTTTLGVVNTGALTPTSVTVTGNMSAVDITASGTLTAASFAPSSITTGALTATSISCPAYSGTGGSFTTPATTISQTSGTNGTVSFFQNPNLGSTSQSCIMVGGNTIAVDRTARFGFVDAATVADRAVSIGYHNRDLMTLRSTGTNVVGTFAATGNLFAPNLRLSAFGSDNFYEHGTLVPTLAPKNGTASVSYTVRTGRYTRVGAMYTCHFIIESNGYLQTSGTGGFGITDITPVPAGYLGPAPKPSFILGPDQCEIPLFAKPYYATYNSAWNMHTVVGYNGSEWSGISGPNLRLEGNFSYTVNQ
jgi:hypothetical protein